MPARIAYLTKMKTYFRNFWKRIKIMFDKDAFAAEVAAIAAEHAAGPKVDPAALEASVNAAVDTHMQPALDRIDVLEKAMADLGAALTAKDVAAAEAIVAAVPAPEAPEAPAA